MTGRPWFLGSCGWPGARVAVPASVSGGAKRPDNEWEDTTPPPRGEIYKPAVQAPAGTGAAMIIEESENATV